MSFEWWDQYVATSGVQTESATISEAEVVFVGYGIEAPEYNWDDFRHEVTRLAHLDGLPETLAEGEKIMADWCEKQWGEQPAISTIREKLSPLYAYLRSTGAIKS